MKSRRPIVWLAVVILLGLVVYTHRSRIHFDWHVFFAQLHLIAWPHIAIGVALIYTTYVLRAWRWSIFVSSTRKVSPWVILGPQFIGFTAVSLFGRLADLIRPALIARRLQLPVSTQIAVYTIERMFDLGAAAILFSSALLFAPAGLPHREIFIHTGIVSLGLTAFIALFAVLVRAGGETVAAAVHGTLRPLSSSLADSAADKIRGFRDGLNAISSAQDFIASALISLVMWTLIGSAYVQTLHAFTNTPALATISFSRTMLLLGASLGASLLQFPIIGWFTQITATAFAMNQFYGAPIEAATACGALLFMVTWLAIIPAGLIAARLSHVSLKATATEAANQAPTQPTP